MTHDPSVSSSDLKQDARSSWSLTRLAAVGASALLLAATASAGDMADVKAKGKLVVVTYPLLEDAFMQVDMDAMRKAGVALKDLHDPAAFTGIDLELMKGFAEKLGVQLEIRPNLTGYGDLIPALDRREGDMVASSFAITPARTGSATFSTPYILQWDVAAVRPDSKIRSMADLKGKKVAVIQGSSHHERLKALNLNPQIQFTKFVLEGYTAVSEGQADYTIMESRANVGEVISPQYRDLVVAVRVNETGYGVAMRKGSDLKEPFDAYLEGLRKSGDLEKILRKYGQGSPAMPLPPIGH